MVDRALDAPAEDWPNDRAILISFLEGKKEQEDVDRMLRFINEHTTADEAPNCLLRLVLAMASIDPSILTDGSCVEFVKSVEEQGPELFEVLCSTEDLGATIVLIKQELLGLK